MVKVSIITPTFNRRHLIGQTIDSVLAQSYSDYELIILDDGSNDNTEAYVKKQYSDPRIKYYYQENRGQNFARNHALKYAQGEYICFLDSDDMWPEYKLSKSLEIFQENPEVDVVYGYEMVIDEQGQELGKDNMKRYSGKVTSPLLVENFIGMSAAMVRASKVREIGGMDETIKVADDYSLWLRLSCNSNFFYIDQLMGYYRLTTGQISSDIIARLDSNIYIVTKFLEDNPDVISREDKADALCQLYSKRVRLLRKYGKYRQAVEELTRAFRCNPRSLLPWRSFYRLIFPATE